MFCKQGLPRALALHQVGMLPCPRLQLLEAAVVLWTSLPAAASGAVLVTSRCPQARQGRSLAMCPLHLVMQRLQLGKCSFSPETCAWEPLPQCLWQPAAAQLEAQQMSLCRREVAWTRGVTCASLLALDAAAAM